MNDVLISILDILEDTIVDGPGFRTTVYAAGCPNRCPGCHNPDSWDINKGAWRPVSEIAEKLLSNELADVTFSGGDPFFQVEGFIALADKIKKSSHKTIWCYTGWTYEEIIKDAAKAPLLNYIDVLVDGKYEHALRDTTILFRGSKNQRLIDVQKSLRENKTILYEYNPYPF